MTRPHIKSEIKRRVRQKCKFGCVICRCPIYDYEHFDEYTQVKEHRAENIFLICPTCHRKKGTLYGRDLILQKIKEINTDATKAETISIDAYTFELGNNTIGVFHDGVSFGLSLPNGTHWSFSNANGRCLINSTIIDSQLGKVIEIHDNELVINTGVYDIEFSGGRLVIKKSAGDVVLNLAFKGDENKLSVTGKLEYSANKTIIINNTGIYCEAQLLVSDCCFNAPKCLGLKIIEDINEDGAINFGSSVLFNIANVESCSFGANGDTGILFTTGFLDSVAKNGYTGGAKCMTM